jgi:hypothetical protein
MMMMVVVILYRAASVSYSACVEGMTSPHRMDGDRGYNQPQAGPYCSWSVRTREERERERERIKSRLASEQRLRQHLQHSLKSRIQMLCIVLLHTAVEVNVNIGITNSQEKTLEKIIDNHVCNKKCNTHSARVCIRDLRFTSCSHSIVEALHGLPELVLALLSPSHRFTRKPCAKWTLNECVLQCFSEL